MSNRKDPLQFPQYSEVENEALAHLVKECEGYRFDRVSIVEIGHSMSGKALFKCASAIDCESIEGRVIYRNSRWRRAAEAERAAAARAEEKAQ